MYFQIQYMYLYTFHISIYTYLCCLFIILHIYGNKYTREICIEERIYGIALICTAIVLFKVHYKSLKYRYKKISIVHIKIS